MSTGDEFPVNVQLPYLGVNHEDDGPKSYDLKKELPGKKVVLTSAIGAFTPPCSNQHLPNYLSNLKKFKSKGIDQVIVLTINDPFVNNAWAKSLGYKDDDNYVIFAQDPDLKLSKELGDNYVANMSSEGLGTRSGRYAALIVDGKIQYLGAEEGGDFTDISSADNLLEKL